MIVEYRQALKDFIIDTIDPIVSMVLCRVGGGDPRNTSLLSYSPFMVFAI